MFRPRAGQLQPHAESTEGDERHQREAQRDHDAELRDEREGDQGQHPACGGEQQAGRAGGQGCARDIEKGMRVGRRRRDQDVVLAPEPEHDGRDEHQRARDAEGDGRAQLLEEHRHQQRGEERPEVDDPVEGVEHDLGAVLVGRVELVAHERGDTRLDAAGTERNQAETGVEARAVGLEQRQAEVAEAVDEAQPEYRVIFAEEPVRQPAAEQREEIHADDKGVENVLRRAGAVALRQVHQQRRDEEHREDVPHAVKTEALATLVADDVGNLTRDARLGIRRDHAAGRGWAHGDGPDAAGPAE
jgi:hypothetical protein